MKASIANSIQRSLGYLETGQFDYALASIDGLGEHVESLTTRGREADGAEEFAATELVQIEAALRDASLDILMQRPQAAHERLSAALSALTMTEFVPSVRADLKAREHRGTP